MPRLRDRFCSSASPWRDRLGILCAIGAVACLASLITRWSRQYPVQRSSWEQDLFGDLAEIDPAADQSSTSVVKPSHSHSALSREASNRTTLTSIGETADNEPILVEVTPNIADHVLVIPIDGSPAASRPRFTQLKDNKQPSNGEQRCEDEQRDGGQQADNGQRTSIGGVQPVSLIERPSASTTGRVTRLLHERANSSPSVWLSGAIEVESKNQAKGSTPPVTLFFPNESQPR